MFAGGRVSQQLEAKVDGEGVFLTFSLHFLPHKSKALSSASRSMLVPLFTPLFFFLFFFN